MKNIDRLPFPDLIEEFTNFSVNAKARIVHNKCLRAGKFSLAQKIAYKHGLKAYNSDAVVASKMAMIAIKNKQR